MRKVKLIIEGKQGSGKSTLKNQLVVMFEMTGEAEIFELKNGGYLIEYDDTLMEITEKETI